jgi:hypothetical protein
MNFFETIAFTPAYPERRQERLKHADFEKLAPKICDMNPHSIFAFWGCPRSQNKMTQTNFGAACSSEINTFYRVHLSQPVLEILIFLGFFRFSPILTLWTLQTAVTRSFMVRFEKFLQFWNGHDVASRGEASDTRLRSRRV